MKKIFLVMLMGVSGLMFVSPAFSLDETNGAFTYFISVVGVSSMAPAPPAEESASVQPAEPSEPVAEEPVDEVVKLAK